MHGLFVFLSSQAKSTAWSLLLIWTFPGRLKIFGEWRMPSISLHLMNWVRVLEDARRITLHLMTDWCHSQLHCSMFMCVVTECVCVCTLPLVPFKEFLLQSKWWQWEEKRRKVQAASLRPFKWTTTFYTSDMFCLFTHSVTELWFCFCNISAHLVINSSAHRCGEAAICWVKCSIDQYSSLANGCNGCLNALWMWEQWRFQLNRMIHAIESAATTACKRKKELTRPLGRCGHYIRMYWFDQYRLDPVRNRILGNSMRCVI